MVVLVYVIYLYTISCESSKCVIRLWVLWSQTSDVSPIRRFDTYAHNQYTQAVERSRHNTWHTMYVDDGNISLSLLTAGGTDGSYSFIMYRRFIAELTKALYLS